MYYAPISFVRPDVSKEPGIMSNICVRLRRLHYIQNMHCLIYDIKCKRRQLILFKKRFLSLNAVLRQKKKKQQKTNICWHFQGTLTARVTQYYGNAYYHTSRFIKICKWAAIIKEKTVIFCEFLGSAVRRELAKHKHWSWTFFFPLNFKRGLLMEHALINC